MIDKKDHKGIFLLLTYISHYKNGQIHYRILEAVSEMLSMIYCQRQDARLDALGILSAKKCFNFFQETVHMCLHTISICLLL